MRNFRKQLGIILPAIFITTAPMAFAAEEGVFESAGVPIHYVDNGGDGAPVVLIHSFASTSELWQLNGIFDAEGFRTIAIDLRGHGERIVCPSEMVDADRSIAGRLQPILGKPRLGVTLVDARHRRLVDHSLVRLHPRHMGIAEQCDAVGLE